MNITFEFVLFILLIWLLVYALIDRICRCIEQGHISSSYNAEIIAKAIKNEEETRDAKNITKKSAGLIQIQMRKM